VSKTSRSGKLVKESWNLEVQESLVGCNKSRSQKSNTSMSLVFEESRIVATKYSKCQGFDDARDQRTNGSNGDACKGTMLHAVVND
jgi:hypothetical protein